MSSDAQSSSSSSPDNGSIRKLFFGRRFSNMSAFSLATINTVLPEYSAVDADESFRGVSVYPIHASSQFPSQILRTPSSANHDDVPPTYSLKTSTLLTWSPDSPVTPDNIEAQLHSHGFHYWYSLSPNDTWATLHLYTHDTVPGIATPSTTQPKVPRLWSCDPVAGMLELDLTNSMTIQQIKISLRGKIITSSLDGGSFQFLNHESILWQKSYGDPRHFNTNERRSNERFNGKFFGKYSFPFSLSFPSCVDVQTRAAILPDSSSFSPFPALAASPASAPPPSSLNSSRPPDHKTRKPKGLSWISGTASSAVPSGASRSNGTFSDGNRQLPSVQRTNDRSDIGSVASSIPQSFLEKGVTATVVYELSAIITHGRFKADSKIKTNVSYIPALHPMPVSQMRRDAYASNGHVPGPIKDPTGWFALPNATSSGMFFDNLRQRQVAIECTFLFMKLYLAEPLSYARGAVIPCFLRLSSTDGEALRSLSAPEVPAVKLLRRLRYFEPNRDDPYAKDHQIFDADFSGFIQTPLSVIVPNFATIGKTSDFKVVGHELGAARWRVPPNDDVPQEPYVRHLEGELHLRVDLQPSCTSQIFYIEYFVEMMALQADYFKPKFPPNWPGKIRGGQHVISSVPVEITTLHRTDEPLPIAFSECPALKMRHIPFEDGILEEAELEI